MNIIKGPGKIRNKRDSDLFFSFFFSPGNSFQCFSIIVRIEGEQSKTGGRDLAVVMNRASDMSLQCDIESILFLKEKVGAGGRFRLFSSKVFFPTVKNNRK